jgi:hypothetical protein
MVTERKTRQISQDDDEYIVVQGVMCLWKGEDNESIYLLIRDNEERPILAVKMSLTRMRHLRDELTRIIRMSKAREREKDVNRC